MGKNVFGVRRFITSGERPDCFEVYDRRNGACASFGMFRYQAEQTARAKNREHREQGWYAEPTKPLA